ncbi:helix-turn-helix domain-containing protein [Phormidium tenue FACHB-886]|nr:helix-turn-helix domain-containing protein [Phormidium tenue FACHB-886]
MQLTDNFSNLSELGTFSVPTPSCLYNLEPIALSTAFTESVSSYISRLAQAHAVPTGILVTRQLAGFSQRENRTLNRILGKHSRTVNGFGAIASDTTQALAQVTLRNDLHKLRLYRWFDTRSSWKILRLHKAWCPICYSEWSTNSQIIYEPLLWALELVTICPVHHKKLITYCPYCNEESFPLRYFSRPGYCSNCKKWLGKEDEEQKTALDLTPKELKWGIFIAENIGKLLEIIASDAVITTGNELSKRVLTLVNQVTHGNILKFSRMTGVPQGVLHHWINQRHMPSINSILKICYALNLSFSEFAITSNNISAVSENIFEDEISLSIHRQENQDSSLNKTIYFPSSKMIDIKTNLENILMEDRRPPTLTHIANQLNISLKELKLHFPEFHTAIIVKRSKYPKTQPICYRLEMARSCLNDAICNSDQLPPLYKFSTELEFNKETLERYFPDLCDKYELARTGKLEEKHIQKPQSIEEVFITILESRDCPPAPFDIALKLQIEEAELYAKFPVFCQEILKRRSNYSRIAAVDKYREVERLIKIELEKALCDSTPFEVFCDSNGFHSQTIEKWFPEECRVLRDRSIEYRKIRRSETLKQLRKEVQEAVITLFNQEICPSESEVRKLLTKPKCVLDPEFPAIYQETLREVSRMSTSQNSHAHIILNEV